jgi:aminodeoxyfutalosine deaminase
MNQPPTLLLAAAIADGSGRCFSPGAMLLRGRSIETVGSPQRLGAPSPGMDVRRWPGSVLIPGLVNAHAHLDLTHVGPLPHTGDFISWVERVRALRAADDQAIAASVRRGAELSRAGGTVLIGDIAGVRSSVPVHALRETGLPGTSFLEVFGLGRRQAEAIDLMTQRIASIETDAAGVRLGIQPHAPYSCGTDVYAAACRLRLPLATHVAETLEELRVVATGDGPLAEMLQRLGVWDDSIRGCGGHPLDHLAAHFASVPFLAAHLNYVDDAHIEALSRWPITIAYCPRASGYFGHPHHDRPAHRYRDMLAAGVAVALGTDSLLCLDTPGRLSVLDDMRFLHRRDGVDPITLLRMATVHGAHGLERDPGPVTFQPGVTAGILAVDIDSASSLDPLRQMLRRDDPPRWVIEPSRGAWP